MWALHHHKSRPRRRQAGGIALHGGPTRRRHAVRGLLVVQNPHRSRLKCAASPTSPGRSTGWREKVRPARPLRRLFREKVLPARVKTPNLGQFERTGRTFSRFHDLTATQGELFRARRRRPSSALPISDPSPTGMEGARVDGGHGRTRGDAQSRTSATRPNWCGGRRRARRARPRRQWITGPGRSIHKQQQHPAQTNFACNSPTTRIDTRSKTAEYQRSDFNS